MPIPPGTSGNPFDLVLTAADRIGRLPRWLFAVVLLALAWLGGRFEPARAGALWLFFLVDWLLLALLPRVGLSFGPPLPPTLALALARTPFALLLPAPLDWLAQACGTLLVIYAFWFEPHHLTVTRQRLRAPGWSGPPLRLLHLGDLHIERVTQRERALNQLVRDLQPDVIVFTGDVLNLSYLRDLAAHAAAREVLQAWAAPLGVFAVSGSPAVDLPDLLPQLLEGLPLRRLQGEVVTLTHHGQSIDLIGLDCSHQPDVDGPRLQAALASAGSPPERLKVLLYHSPDLAPEAAAAGVHLQLSGHTHGGQVRLPFYGALYAGSIYGKRFEAGRMQVGGLTLYVTRGIGMEGKGAPRVRFLCPPEIILWEIGADDERRTTDDG